MSRWETDVLVAGAGMGAMAAAARATQLGAQVTVVEKAPQLGGSAVLSGGYLWTAQSFELLRAGGRGGAQAIPGSA